MSLDQGSLSDLCESRFLDLALIDDEFFVRGVHSLSIQDQ